MRETLTGNLRRVSSAMVRRTVLILVVVAAGAIVLGVASAPAATSRIPYVWQNCTHVHTKYRHGVGPRVRPSSRSQVGPGGPTSP